MGIFATPKMSSQENSHGVKIMFLHGLEGSHKGTKATALSKEWAAVCPPLRTEILSSVRNDCSGVWSNVSQDIIDEALDQPYFDAKDAIRYSNPDLVVGSSMGAAILFKLIASGEFSGLGVFCAPAIGSLLSSSFVEKAIDEKRDSFKDSVWLLGEADTIVSNPHNVSLARRLGGSIIFSPGDSHRLNKAVNSNILNSSIVTAIELSNK